MLAARIEQKTRPRLDDTAQPMFLQQSTNLGRALGQIGLERIENVMVQCQGDAAIAQIRDDRQGIFEPVMGEAVGVVAEEHLREPWTVNRGP